MVHYSSNLLSFLAYLLEKRGRKSRWFPQDLKPVAHQLHDRAANLCRYCCSLYDVIALIGFMGIECILLPQRK